MASSKTLKSSADLIMERLAQKDGAGTRLSAAQKSAMAEIDRQCRAKIAELEIMNAARLAAARAEPEAQDKLDELQRELKAEMDTIKARAEDEKDKVRRGEGAG